MLKEGERSSTAASGRWLRTTLLVVRSSIENRRCATESLTAVASGVMANAGSVRSIAWTVCRTAAESAAGSPLVCATTHIPLNGSWRYSTYIAFAAIALFLAAVGLYGVVAYTVSQRTQEIGLRMAIGAQHADVLRLVVGGGMKLALAGVAIGIACALAMSQLVATMLFEVTPFDPASYSTTAIILLGVAGLACYIPARRATRVDPIVALRQE